MTDEQIDSIASEQTGFDGFGTQSMDAGAVRRIVRAALAAQVAPEPVWPTRCELESAIGKAYSNGWNECLSDCKRAYAALAVQVAS